MNIFKSISSGITASIAALTVTTLSFVNPSNAALSNSNATQAAQNVYSYMENLSHGNNNSVLTGHFAGYSEQTFNMMQTTAVKNLANDEWPGILSGDYMNWSRTDWGGNASTTYCADQISYGCNSDLIKYYRAGGLVTISIHMPNPFYSTGETVKTEISNTDYASLTNHSSTYGARWEDMLDNIAAGLKELQDAGVPVLFRPLHEMNGDWFWWGQENSGYNDTRANHYKALWIDMYNYFKNTKGLNNLIWIYSPDQSAGYLTNYYPGNSYVDMVGLDAYTNDPSSQNLRDKYTTMRNTYSSKPFAFTEIGPSTTGGFNYGSWATAIHNYYSAACYFLAWNDAWSPQNNTGTSTLYNDSWMINRHEVNFTRPSWSAPAIPGGATTFTDNCADYNGVYQKSGSLSIDATNTTLFNGDAGRFCRSALSTQYVTYNKSNVNTFSVKVYHQDDEAGASLKFFVSSDNSNWTQIPTSATAPVATSSSWFYSYFTPIKYVPSGKNYLKIEWTDGTVAWSPQISEVIIYHGISGYSITASAGSNGTITPTSTTAGIGSDVTFNITPTSGYDIDQLTDNGVTVTATNNQYTITNIGAAHTVAVTFKVGPTNLLTNPSFEYDGAATQTPYGWTEWNAPTASYTENITPKTGTYNLAHWASSAYQVSTYKALTGLQNGLYTFRAWVRSSGGQSATYINAKNYGGAEKQAAIPTTSTYTLVSITDINVTNGTCEISFYSNANAGNWINADDAEFFLQGSGGPSYTVTASAGSNGSISPTSSSVASGGSQTLTITPNSGYQIATLTDNGTNVTATNNQYVVSNVTANRTIAVTFSALPTYTVTASAGSNGSISPTSSTVASGGSQTLTITPNSGYQIATLTDNGTNVTATNNQYVVSNVTANRTIAVTFSAVTSTQLSISSAVASCDDGNVAANTIDGNTSTRWACITNGATVTFTLPSTKTIKDVKISWYNGNARTYYYDIYTSTDGTNYTQYGSRYTSSGTTTSLESNVINSVSARYIRIACFGSNVSAWNSIPELQIWGN
jgi:mannan endo-1,4-beta-mannosidase